MKGAAIKNKIMQSQSLSTGVELGSWAAASGTSLPVSNITVNEVVRKLGAEKDTLTELTEKIQETSQSESSGRIPTEVLNESID